MSCGEPCRKVSGLYNDITRNNDMDDTGIMTSTKVKKAFEDDSVSTLRPENREMTERILRNAFNEVKKMIEELDEKIDSKTQL